MTAEVGHSLRLEEVANDFADALAWIDATGAKYKQFRPGIGTFGETDAVRAALTRLQGVRPEIYADAVIKRLPDLLIPGEWAIEFKVLRPFGDNGRPVEHWSENVLHPYPGNTSSIGDCMKLLDAGLAERRAIVILGYEQTPPTIPLDAAIDSFEVIARNVCAIDLGPRIEERRVGLTHPVHQQLRLVSYEVRGALPTDRG